jgi:YVTN family beta-propeller protein
VINGANNTVIASIAVGSNPRGVAYDPSNGYVYVTNWNSGTVSIISTPHQVIKKYSVTFTESGLPTGTSWSLTLNGTTETSTTSIISFTEPNGTYSFSIASINGYSVSPSSGSITVNGSNVNQGITFTLNGTKVFVVTFTENGLPSGTIWYVNLSNGQSFSSTTNIITFNEPNGTYSYTISTKDKNYAPVISSGTFTVNGANVNQTITFKAVTTPTNYLLYIIIVIVVIIAVLGVVMAMRRGKNKGGPKQWQEPPKQQPPQQ